MAGCENRQWAKNQDWPCDSDASSNWVVGQEQKGPYTLSC